MKILLVTNMYPTDNRPNYGIFVKEQVEAVGRCFNDVEYDIYYINTENGYSEYLRSITIINNKIKTRKYDLVHVHYGLSGLFLLNPFAVKIPVAVTLHGGDIQPEQGKTVQVAITKRILHRADIAISLNDRMTMLAQKHCQNTVKIPCSVNTDIFTPPSARKSLKNRNELTVVFPSDRNRTVKNYPLFQATVKMLERKQKIKVNEILLTGMSRKEVADTLKKADIMLMTSISEGSPQAVKEAMACNLPIVSTKVGDIDYLLENVTNSYWSDVHTPESLCDEIIKVIDNDLPSNGREQIFALGLDDNSIAEKIHHIYKNLLSR